MVVCDFEDQLAVLVAVLDHVPCLIKPEAKYIRKQTNKTNTGVHLRARDLAHKA